MGNFLKYIDFVFFKAYKKLFRTTNYSHTLRDFLKSVKIKMHSGVTEDRKKWKNSVNIFFVLFIFIMMVFCVFLNTKKILNILLTKRKYQKISHYETKCICSYFFFINGSFNYKLIGKLEMYRNLMR